MKSLKGTQTAESLLKAFAGESQARNRYTFYANTAKEEGYLQIANIFAETAWNERAHAERFFSFLTPEFKGEELLMHDAGYPIGLGTTEENLGYAAEGEHDEWSNLYPAFAEIADKEGFPQIAGTFRMIAKAEVNHETRFLKLQDNIKNEEVFAKIGEDKWICLNCGYIHVGKNAPLTCPTCLKPQKYFQLFRENY